MYDTNAPVLSPSDVSPAEPRQSKLGIASFAVSLVGLLFFCIGFAISFVYGASLAAGNPVSPSINTASPLMMAAGALMCLSMVIAVVGLVLGIVAMTRKDEKRGFGVAGLVISGLIVLVYCVLTVIGLIAQTVG